MKHAHESPPPSGHPGHETRDTNTRAVLIAGVGLAVLIVVSLILMNWAFDLLSTQPADSATTAQKLRDLRRPPVGPALMQIPAAELAALRSAEDKRLHSYGRNPDGSVRIPIERAMALVLERGLPVRPQPATAPAEITAASTQPGGQ